MKPIMKTVWDWLFLNEFLKNLNPKNSLEIGVDKGLTFSLIHQYSGQSLGIEKYARFKYPKEWNILIKDSKDLDEGDLNKNLFFDFIHIDGDHSFDCVIRDLETCNTHSNNNTIICVDDYVHRQSVSDAVTMFLKKRNRNMFIKYQGQSQICLVTEESEKIFDNVILNFDKEIAKLLKLKSVLTTTTSAHFSHSDDIKILTELSNRSSEHHNLKNLLDRYLKLI